MSATHFPLRKSLRVIVAVGWSDFVLKYRGSVLGYFWSLIGPVAKFVVILYAIGPFVQSTITHYPFYLFLGIIVWEYFVVTTNACMSMLEEKAGIIQKLVFPRILLIFMVGWTNMLVFLTHLLIFLFFLWFFGFNWGWNQLYIFLLLFQMTLIALGVGMMLCAYCLRYRDIHHIWGIVTQIFFWLTPITYAYKGDQPVGKAFIDFLQAPSIHGLTQFFDVIVRFQPVSILVNDMHRVLLYPLEQGIPSITHAIAFTILCILIFAFGCWLYQKRAPYFIEEY
jgi:ABC-type polysaccharide/polyol phosphate export permease